MARALSVLSSAPLLVVSPHFDDGALSCGALFDREEPVDLLTVFSGGPEQVMHTSWDRACGFADSTEAMRHRQEEERRAFAPEGHRLHELDLIDAQYDGPRGDAEASALTGWLETWVAATSGDGVVALPAGAGWPTDGVASRLGQRAARLLGRAARWGRVSPKGELGARLLEAGSGQQAHRDHIWVRDVGVSLLAGRLDVRVLLYEELPYHLSRAADVAVRRLGRRYRCSMERVSLRPDIDTKARRIGGYESQLRHLWSPRGRLDAPTSLPAVERYWWMHSSVLPQHD